MGIVDIRNAFTQASDGKLTCTAARMRYVASNGHPEWQQLEFEGIKADGTPFDVICDPVSPGGDLLGAASAAALKLIGP